MWKKSIEMVKGIYLLTKRFPNEEVYGLTSQMRRAAISIPSNIAEGKSRRSKSEYVQFLYVALGSAAELETQTIIARELKYINEEQADNFLENLNHVARMLQSLITKLQKHNPNR